MAEPLRVVAPRTRFDRTLARQAIARVFESLPGALTRDYRILAEMKHLRSAECHLPLEERKFRLSVLEAEHKVLKETILDRTMPVLQRVDMRALMAQLPLSPDEAMKREQAGAGDNELKKLVHEELRKAVQLRIVGRVEPIHSNGDGSVDSAT